MEEANLLPYISTHIVRDGEEALDILQTGGIAFDLILLDLNMPKVSGKEVLAQAGRAICSEGQKSSFFPTRI